ncbi:hypothetical protein P7C71_g1494, partial [Lecanoromycetidae sp. Uapishka_2]
MTGRMSTNAVAPSPKGKGAATNDIDSIMPLLFATIGNPPINFKNMSAMDTEGRSASALEHKFRKWRQKGREIAEANPNHAGTMATTAGTTPTKRPSAKKNGNEKGKAKQADIGEEEGEADESVEEAGIKKEEDMDMGNDEMTPSATNGSNGINKRAASKDIEVGDEDGETPTKKAKVTKKGTAAVVKKQGPKARESLESVGDEEDEAQTPKKAKPKRKPAAKGRGKASTIKVEEEPKPVKKWKAEAMAAASELALKEGKGADHGLNGVDGEGEEDGLAEMEFQLEDEV